MYKVGIDHFYKLCIVCLILRIKTQRACSAHRKYNRNHHLKWIMRQEHVTLQNVEVSQIYDRIKKYLQDLKLDIIHEEKIENYWDIKAHKGTKGSVIIGNVRDVEVMISGTQGNYDLILRTWCLG